MVGRYFLLKILPENFHAQQPVPLFTKPTPKSFSRLIRQNRLCYMEGDLMPIFEGNTALRF